MTLTAGELRAIAELLDTLDKTDTSGGDVLGGDEYAVLGDIPIHVGETHMLVGYATNEDGEGHLLRLA